MPGKKEENGSLEDKVAEIKAQEKEKPEPAPVVPPPVVVVEPKPVKPVVEVKKEPTVQDELDSLRQQVRDLTAEVDKLKKEEYQGRFDDLIYVNGLSYRVVHQNTSREFLEDLKKRMISEDALCLAVIKS